MAETARRMLRSTLSLLPIDLVVVVAFVAFATATVSSGPGGSVGQFLVGVGLVLVAPGYAVVAALFPGRPQPREGRSPTNVLALSRAHDGVLVRERLALSAGVSILLIPLYAVGLGVLGIGLTRASVLAVVWLVVGLGLVTATIRRFALPPDARFDPLALLQRVGTDRSLGEDPATALLTAALCCGAVVALASFTVAIAGPAQTMSYTSASILTPNASGEPVASGYPTNASQGEAVPLVVRVSNHHETAANYTVVARLQRVDGGQVLAGERLWRGQRRLGVDDTWTAPHTVRPSIVGEDLRLTYFVYRGSSPDTGAADKTLYLRFDVVSDGPTGPSRTADT